MIIKITEPGVFDAAGAELAVGKIVEVHGDEFPGWLAGKAVAMDMPPPDVEPEVVAVTNPAKDAKPGKGE